ncbi:MAG TPA: hypothetical protein DCR04_10670, partial [Flavobacteriales bacterium]|nr:hypothetical protein [Flavobacteriales bacterium]
MGVIFQLMLSVVLFACGSTSSEPENNETLNQTPEEVVDGKLSLEVSIKGASNDLAKLLGVFGNQNFIADSARSDANGKFVFDADTLLPSGFYYLMLGSDNSYFQLVLDKDQEFKLEATKGDYVNSMRVEGCLDNELLYKNLKFEAEFGTRLQPVNKQLAALSEGTAEYNGVKAKQEALIKERVDHVQWFSNNHPNAFFTKFKMSGQNPDLTYPKLPSG